MKAQQLLVRQRGDGLLDWLALDRAGQPVGETRSGDWDALAAAAGNRPLRWLLAASDVTLSELNLPTRNRQRIAQAVPGLLESQLGEPIDRLCFAVGRADAAGRVPVAVARRALLDDIVERCDGQGLRLAGLLPETLLLPLHEGRPSLLLAEGQLVLRSGPCAGQGLDADALALLLGRLDPAVGLRCWADAASRSRLRQALPDAGIESLADRLALYAGQLPGALDFWPQLAGESARQWPAWRLWAPAAAMLALAALLHAGFLLHERGQLRIAQRQLTQQIRSDFRAAFPQVKRLVDPLAQAEQLLRSRAGAAGDVDFALLLNALADAVQQTEPRPQLLSLGFRDGRLEARLQVDKLPRLEQLQQLIKGLGIGVELTTAEQGERVTGALRLKRGAS